MSASDNFVLQVCILIQSSACSQLTVTDDPPIPRTVKVGTKLLKELYRGSKF